MLHNTIAELEWLRRNRGRAVLPFPAKEVIVQLAWTLELQSREAGDATLFERARHTMASAFSGLVAEAQAARDVDTMTADSAPPIVPGAMTAEVAAAAWRWRHSPSAWKHRAMLFAAAGEAVAASDCGMEAEALPAVVDPIAPPSVRHWQRRRYWHGVQCEVPVTERGGLEPPDSA